MSSDPHQTSCTVMGLGTTVRITNHDLTVPHEALLRAWSRALITPSQSPTPDAQPAETTPGSAGLIDAGEVSTGKIASMSGLTQQVTRAMIAARTGDLVMMHAGALCHPETGATLVYSAPGGTGKTTLTTYFGTRYGYLSDETAGITATGEVLAYPKPLSTRNPDHHGKDEISPDDLGLMPAHPHPWLAGIVILDRNDAYHGVEAETLHIIDAIEALVPPDLGS